MSVISNIVAKLSLDNSKFKTGLTQSTVQTEKFGNKMASVGKIMAGAFSVVAITKFTSAAVKAYDVQAKAEEKLLVALKGRIDVQKRLLQQSSNLQGTTLYGDEETIEAQARLAALGLQEQAIKKLIPLVQDLATKSNMSLVSTADMVAKSVGSSTNALSRYGITIEGAVGSADRLNSAVQSLNQQVGGQAAAAAKVGTGAITQLSNAWGDLMEEFGAGIANDFNIALIKALTDLLRGGEVEEVFKTYGDNGVLTEAFLSTASKDDLLNEMEALRQRESLAFNNWRIKETEEERSFWAGQYDIAKENIDLIQDAIDALDTTPVVVTPQREEMSISQIDAGVEGISGIWKGATTALADYIEQIQEHNREIEDTSGKYAQLAGSAELYKGKQVEVNEEMVNFGNIANDVVASAITNLADMMVSIVEGDNILDAFANFLKSMGNMMAKYGALLIAQGVAQQAFEKGGATTKIVAGAAMLALGLAVSAGGAAINRSGSSGSGSGGGYSSVGGSVGYSGSGYYSGPGTSGGSNEIVLKAKGSDLVAVIDEQTFINNVNG